MDKITRIHIAKVAYEISPGAHGSLDRYLGDIRGAVDPGLADEVMRDVEVRITEILGERGITKGGVITADDIQFVQKKLGTPEQFGEAADDEQPKVKTARGARKL